MFCICISPLRSWGRCPPSPSTRRTAARCTWAKTLSIATSSAPKAPRWTSWYPKTTESLWVSGRRTRRYRGRLPVCLLAHSGDPTPPFFFLPPPCRTSLRFPSSIRPSGMAKSLSPTYPKSPARRGSVRSPSHSRVTIHIHPHPSHSFAKASVTDLPPHQLTFTL